jgi:ATP-dependent protease ClpP protease subunit
MRRTLPDLRNARAGIEPHRIARAEGATPVGLRITNDANDASITELWIYEEIGMWGIGAQDVIDALAEVTTPNLRVRLNSPGGDVFDGIAIMNALASFPGEVTGVVDSLCASIATAIAMACETLTMSPGSQMMIHPASGICFGDEAAMTKMAALLSFQTRNIASLYAGKAGGTEAEWLGLMQAETWMTADEAVTAGLADDTGVVKQSGQSVVPAGLPSWDDLWDLSVFRFAGRAHAPAPGDKASGNSTANVACACGPKGWPLVATSTNHYEGCPRLLDGCVPRLANLPQPAGVQWEVVPFDGCCDICQDVIDSGPYAEDDLPDVPVHPNCDCELQVAYGVDNHASSAIEAEARTDINAIVRESIRRVTAA